MKSNQSSQKPFEGTDSTVFATNFWPSKMHGVVSPFLQNKEIRVNHMKNIWLGSLGGLALAAMGLASMVVTNRPQNSDLDSTMPVTAKETHAIQSKRALEHPAVPPTDAFATNSLLKSVESKLAESFDPNHLNQPVTMSSGFLASLTEDTLGAELIDDGDTDLLDAIEPIATGATGGAGGLDPVFDSEGNEVLGILIFGPEGNKAVYTGSGNGFFRASLPGYLGRNPGGPVAIASPGARSAGYPVYVPYVPEPASAALFLAGSFALAYRRRRLAH